MADRTDRLVLLDEAADELDRVLVDAQQVGVGHAAGQHERVIVGRVGIGDGLLCGDLVALVEVVPHLDLALLERDDLGLGARLLDRFERLSHLDLLGAFREQERHFLPLELVSHSSSGSFLLVQVLFRGYPTRDGRETAA